MRTAVTQDCAKDDVIRIRVTTSACIHSVVELQSNNNNGQYHYYYHFVLLSILLSLVVVVVVVDLYLYP